VNADALNRNPVVMIVMITFKEKQQNPKGNARMLIGEHQGVQRTCDRLKLYVTWPGMFYDVQNYISKCKVW